MTENSEGHSRRKANDTEELTLPSGRIDDIIQQIEDARWTPDEIPPDFKQLARDMCAALDMHQYASSRRPSGLCAAAIYAAGLIHDTENLTQDRIEYACNASKVTIRNHYEEIIRIWAEANADDLDADQRRYFKQLWGADIEVPDSG